MTLKHWLKLATEGGSLEIKAGDTIKVGEDVSVGDSEVALMNVTEETAKITLGEKGTVYSNADVTANLTYVEGFEAAPLETKVYKSITDEVGEKTFTNGYTTVKTEVEEPTEEPTEEVKDEETKDEVKDEEKNPQTSDGIVLTFIALAISGAVAIIAKKKLA